jgi:phage tail sheath gpL-like
LRNEAIRRTRAELREHYRQALADLLAQKAATGSIRLRGTAEEAAALLIAIGQGLAAETIACPGWDSTSTIQLARQVARNLLAP